jgi:geranylgeranyl pyrophosphate synthase
MQRVNQLIVARLDSPVHLIPQLAGHLVSAGGKRVRPMLTLLAAQLCGYRGARHVTLAAAVEFIHTATLLHDDVVDASDLRRGLATANTIWGNKPSVLVGDFLFSRAFQLMVEDGSLPILAILSNASAVIAEGEVAQLMTANDTPRAGGSSRAGSGRGSAGPCASATAPDSGSTDRSARPRSNSCATRASPNPRSWGCARARDLRARWTSR